MATVTSPSDATVTQVGPLVPTVVFPALANPLRSAVVSIPPGGSGAGAGATSGQLFPVGNR